MAKSGTKKLRSSASGSAAKSRSPQTPEFDPAESPLLWLSRRKDKNGEPMISAIQFAAGERLRRDFTLGHMVPRTTTNWSRFEGLPHHRAAPGSGLDVAERISVAQESVRRALVGVGPDLSGILIDVCCHLKGLEHTERALQWPQRCGKIILRLALNSLARHYGLLPPDHETLPQPRSRHWGAPDFRPNLEEWA